MRHGLAIYNDHDAWRWLGGGGFEPSIRLRSSFRLHCCEGRFVRGAHDTLVNQLLLSFEEEAATIRDIIRLA